MPRGCTCKLGNPPRLTKTKITDCPVHGDKTKLANSDPYADRAPLTNPPEVIEGDVADLYALVGSQQASKNLYPDPPETDRLA